mgnify:CR=1 FL=1
MKVIEKADQVVSVDIPPDRKTIRRNFVLKQMEDLPIHEPGHVPRKWFLAEGTGIGEDLSGDVMLEEAVIDMLDQLKNRSVYLVDNHTGWIDLITQKRRFDNLAVAKSAELTSSGNILIGFSQLVNSTNPEGDPVIETTQEAWEQSEILYKQINRIAPHEGSLPDISVSLEAFVEEADFIPDEDEDDGLVFWPDGHFEIRKLNLIRFALTEIPAFDRPGNIIHTTIKSNDPPDKAMKILNTRFLVGAAPDMSSTELRVGMSKALDLVVKEIKTSGLDKMSQDERIEFAYDTCVENFDHNLGVLKRSRVEQKPEEDLEMSSEQMEALTKSITALTEKVEGLPKQEPAPVLPPAAEPNEPPAEQGMADVIAPLVQSVSQMVEGLGVVRSEMASMKEGMAKSDETVKGLQEGQERFGKLVDGVEATVQKGGNITLGGSPNPGGQDPTRQVASAAAPEDKGNPYISLIKNAGFMSMNRDMQEMMLGRASDEVTRKMFVDGRLKSNG